MAPCDAQARIRELEDLNFELSKSWREAMIDAKRYRRLRVLGAAPSTWQASVLGTVLCFTNLDSFLDADIQAHPSRGEAKGDLAQPQAEQP